MGVKKIRYFFKHWKLGIHLIFRTKKFGVNNHWWDNNGSIFGWPIWKILLSVLTIKPIIRNYREMKARAGKMAHFMTNEDYELVFGEKIETQ